MEIIFDRTRNSDHVASYLKVFDDGRLTTLALHVYNIYIGPLIF